MLRIKTRASVSWQHTFNPALRSQRQAELCEFKASLVYIVGSRTQRNPDSKSKIKEEKKEEEEEEEEEKEEEGKKKERNPWLI